MPVVYHQLVPANAGLPGYAVAKELARQTVAQFGAVRNLGAGVANASCCAAVAITPAPGVGFPAALPLAGFAAPFPGPPYPGAVTPPAPPVAPALPYGIVYGNSQMAAGGLVLGAVGGHAERAALTAAAGQALHLLPGTTNAVLFVELTPCVPCQNWLNGAGGGVANPFNGVINAGGPTTLHVWWRWAYPTVVPPALPAGAGGLMLLGGAAAMNTFHSGLGWAMAGQLADVNGPTW